MSIDTKNSILIAKSHSKKSMQLLDDDSEDTASKTENQYTNQYSKFNKKNSMKRSPEISGSNIAPTTPLRNSDEKKHNLSKNSSIGTTD